MLNLSKPWIGQPVLFVPNSIIAKPVCAAWVTFNHGKNVVNLMVAEPSTGAPYGETKVEYSPKMALGTWHYYEDEPATLAVTTPAVAPDPSLGG